MLFTKPLQILNKSTAKTLVYLIQFYQASLSILGFGGSCRFTPSCSEYAHHALFKHPTKKAIILILKRLSKCHPLGPSGWDPVPNCNCHNRGQHE